VAYFLGHPVQLGGHGHLGLPQTTYQTVERLITAVTAAGVDGSIKSPATQ